MSYDKPLVALLIGVLSAIPYEIFTRLLVFFGIGKYSVYQLSSLIVTINRPTAFMGGVTASTVAGSIAVVFYYALKKLGWDYLIMKGLFAGLFSWVIMEAIYVWLIEGPKLIQPRPISDYYLEMFGSALFGILLGLLFKKYLLKKSISL